MSVFDSIKDLLAKSSIEYKMISHEIVRTSEESARIRGVELKTGAKAMVLKCSDEFLLFVLPADKKIDWKKLKKLLKISSIRFAAVEEAEKITNVKMGSVPPFGNLLGLKMYMDPGILENEYIHFNPGSLTHTITMKSADLKSIENPIMEKFTV